VTPQRRAIFRVLAESHDHPSAETIYARVRASIPDISLATVYNTLRELADLGEVWELDLGEGKSRYDPNTADHHHLVCMRCHAVVDVAWQIQGLELKPEQRQGYRILRTQVIFQGLCPACQAVGFRTRQSRPG